MTLTHDELLGLLTAAAEAGATRATAHLRPADDLISQNEAWRTYGRATVDRWVEDGRVTPKRMGPAANSRRAYSRSELQVLATAIKATDAVVRKYASHRTR